MLQEGFSSQGPPYVDNYHVDLLAFQATPEVSSIETALELLCFSVLIHWQVFTKIG
jgi:hypothetical protein